jgi:multiple sugar transport system substrate-binding protein
MPKPRDACGPTAMPGRSGRRRLATMADYVLVDMYATAVTGQMTPEDAIAQAEKRANRYYNV